MGRKLKLTPQVHDLIITALGVGCPHEHACQFAGIDHSTFYKWLQIGRDTGKAPYAAFAAAVSQAEARAVVAALAQIDAAARKGHWAAAAWFLERKYPHIYGRRAALDAQPQTITLRVEYEESARDRLSERLGHLAQRHHDDA